MELRVFLSGTALILLTITAVQAPAVLSGSLAGERERGILQLLLTSTATPREIVEGRLLGKLSQVGMIILAGLPVLAFLAPLDGLTAPHLLTLALLLARWASVPAGFPSVPRSSRGAAATHN